MTLYLGDKVIASSNNFKTNIPYDLLESKYSDIEITNTSWIKSQGQKNSATIYPDVYNKVRQIGKSINEEHTEYDFIYDESDNTFILPLKNGSEDLPSDRYDNLELKTSDSTYIAPANGWFYSYGNTSATNGRVEWFKSNNFGDKSTDPLSGNSIRTSVFAQKGESFKLYYANITPSIAFQYAQGNGDLYYYVGDTVKNSTLIDVAQVTSDLARKVDINSKVIDGQWVGCSILLKQNFGANENVTVDISNYIPNDGYNYELMISGICLTGASSGNYLAIYLGTDIVGSELYDICLMRVITRSSSTSFSGSTANIVVGPGRYVRIFNSGSKSGSGDSSVKLVGYRRIGTNE